MPLNLELQALTLPAGTEFPGQPQGLLDLLAQYLDIIGDENFSGVNYGDTEPTPENRDRPWFKTDSSDNPIGWYGWNGSVWAPIPTAVQTGVTASRPTPPLMGQLYLDTDIDVLLIYTGAAWVTAAGSPGDVKMVTAATLADALTKNPGWVHYTDGIGKVIAGAAADGSNYDDDEGADSYTFQQENLPIETIKLADGVAPYSGSFQNGPQPAGIYPLVTGMGTSATMDTGPLNPDTQVDLDMRQATKYLWFLQKS